MNGQQALIFFCEGLATTAQRALSPKGCHRGPHSAGRISSTCLQFLWGLQSLASHANGRRAVVIAPIGSLIINWFG